MRAIPFFLVTAFFITMNVLLWRSEFGVNHQFGASLPANGVWEKVLTAPDNSFLSIRHHGKKIGTCHWSPSIGQERSARLLVEDAPPEGMIEAPSNYSIDITGNLVIDDANRVRFSVDVGLATNQTWRTLRVHVSLRPSVFELQASAVDESIQIRMDDGQDRIDKSFKFADLRQPDKVLKELGGPLLPAALTSLGLTPALSKAQAGHAPLGLEWKARYDRLRIGGDSMRVIRLTAHLLDRFQVVILVSPVGEILRIELPDEIVLMNDALANLTGSEDDRTPPRR